MNNEIIVYKSDDGKLSFDVKLERETVWLTQAQMAVLFEKERSVISKHISNVFGEKELVEKGNVQKMHISRFKPVILYSLDVVLCVGYRVKSKRGTQFRIWATRILRDHLLDGYSVNIRKMKEIENKLEYLMKKDSLRDQELEQIKEDHKFIRRMQEPKVVVNNYIDAKPLLEVNKKSLEEFSEKFSELNTILNEIKNKLPTTSELKIFINDIQENFKKAQDDPKVKNKLMKTISDLGDNNSKISKMLKGAGIATKMIKKAYEIGLTLIRYIPF